MTKNNSADVKIGQLSHKIWDAINEVDYDPMHPAFDSFEDPVKDEIVKFATDVISGFPNIKVQ